MRATAIIFLFCIPSFASATVFINEVQILPINERFIELYNSENSDVDLTGWYIQRKTATGSSFSSLVSSTQLNGKIIKSHGYFLISRNPSGSSDVTADLTLTESNTIRVRDSKGKDVDQMAFGSIDTGKSRQRISAGEWVNTLPTPGTENVVSQTTTTSPATNVTSNANTAPAQITPQITAQAGPQTRVVLAGAPIIFEGKIAGLGNNSGGAVHTTWSFGDGASAEGESVSHTYYYPGEYTAVLDVVSGSLTATDKMLVRVVLPNLSLSTGGDTARSFFSIKNNGGDELDISSWQVVASDKTFTFPQNTILAARKSATFASEVTGLLTPDASTVELLFSNGSRVEINSESALIAVEPSAKVLEKTVAATVAPARKVPQAPPPQKASIIDSLPDTQTQPITKEEGTLWPWYIGAAFLGALALLGLRLTHQSDEKFATITAEDFEIIEETDDGEPH